MYICVRDGKTDLVTPYEDAAMEWLRENPGSTIYQMKVERSFSSYLDGSGIYEE